MREIDPIFGLDNEFQMPTDQLNKEPILPEQAYRIIKDQLINEGNARQNLATFCQTFMEDKAIALMSESLEKNAIDKSEYPETAELENRCVNILANLWQAPKVEQTIGTSTVGSSEACMLAGLSMYLRFTDHAKEKGLDLTKRPNLIISSGYQVCWEKFCVYWDIEMREVPMDNEHMSMDTQKALALADEYTIGIVAILGITYTGKFDDIKELNERVSAYNQTASYALKIHVDGASGAMFVPFISPELAWDFRLEQVVSINTSGHKYGLVYPGVGWVIWKEKKYIPKRMIFQVSYLGGEIPTIALNFSRSASQILGQYYTFLRYGFDGFQSIHQKTKDVAMKIAKEVEATALFDIYNDGINIPIVCWKLKETLALDWTLYDLTDRLLMKGWQVPSYPLPSNLENVIIQRIVCRSDLGMNMAEAFIHDFKEAINYLQEKKKQEGVYGFTH